MEKSGILYVVGTGPGSSELMTLGAVRTLQKCPVIFYPVTQSKSGQQKSRALETVKGAVDLGKKILLPLEFSMRKNDSLVYEDAKEKCLAFLREGKDCAFVTIGDPSVFSTAGKFASMICGAGFGAKFLAGIPSFCQAAASASTVLCQAEEDLHIICGDEWFFDGRLTKELSSLDGGTKVIMKMNKSLIQILLLTVELGIEEKCLLVQNASMEDERIIYGKDFAAFAEGLLADESFGKESGRYFSVLICRG